MRQEKKFIFVVLGSLGVFVILPAIFVYIVDPYRVYHESLFKNAKFSTQQHYQHAWRINTLLTDPDKNYQSIVIGASAMANYSEKIFNESLPWGTTLNLSINGSAPKMQHAVAQHALRKAPAIKHILWDVHYYHAIDPSIRYGEWNFPYYLYNDTILDDAPYIFNIANVNHGLKFLFGDFSQFNVEADSTPSFKELIAAGGHFNFYGFGKNKETAILDPIINRRLSTELVHAAASENPSLNLYMLDFLLTLCNGDKDINIIFSPTTRRYYTTVEDEQFLYKQISMRRYIVNKTSHCENIKVFAFDNQEDIVDNLAYYADNFHYSIEVNHYVLESISRDDHRLTLSNIDEYEKAFIDALNAYAERGNLQAAK